MNANRKMWMIAAAICIGAASLETSAQSSTDVPRGVDGRPERNRSGSDLASARAEPAQAGQGLDQILPAAPLGSVGID